jgi:hypothetical protein
LSLLARQYKADVHDASAKHATVGATGVVGSDLGTPIGKLAIESNGLQRVAAKVGAAFRRFS